jgi:hypothetical protein
MNDQNLVSFKDMAPSEQREIARKGGIASGKKRKEQASMRKAMQEVMALPVVDDELKAVMSLLGIDEKEQTIHKAIAIVAAIGAQQGDINKMMFCADMNGESIKALELEEKKRSNKAKEKLEKERIQAMQKAGDKSTEEYLKNLMQLAKQGASLGLREGD